MSDILTKPASAVLGNKKSGKLPVPTDAVIPTSSAPVATTTTASSERMSISMADLQTLVTAAVQAAQTNSESQTTKLVEALLESRKPYVDPLQKENEEMMRTQMRNQQEILKQNLENDRLNCEHLQGSNALSDFPSPTGASSIIRHQLDTGELIGICTNCQRIIRHGDPDYRTQLARKTTNRTSQAGQRLFADPLRAIQAGQGKFSVTRVKVVPQPAVSVDVEPATATV